ncbi:hypothetical protein KVG88_13690 [Pseudomonas sp. SWRI74]|uniref:Stage II sporulation protein M n=1 Tax=Pseudomonas azerbaijanoccidentalis TaxID=2842347 RepID=A0ABS6QQA2_9PSED|nr:hypothetical protein [Pseudomonas azerbaijanoccidentalis]MBV4521117.1 hypothetical protein [Pseudomonas azerbaijanoccidentalis]
MSYFRNAFSIIKQHCKVFLALNFAFYGTFALSFFVTMINPELQGYVKPEIDQAYNQPGLLRMAASAFGSQNLLIAISLTFFLNLAVTLGMTTLPSFIIPFVGILAVFHRAALWGVMFAPVGPNSAILIPHSLTLLIEGQAYVLAAFAAYVQGRMLFWPRRYGLDSHLEGYKAGYLSTYGLYSLVVLMLLIGAFYEGIEVIYFMPFFLNP